MPITVSVTVDGCECSHGACRKKRLLWHIGPALNTTPEDRTPGPVPTYKCPREVDLIMDLQADKKVALSVGYTDQVGNPVETPAGATAVYTVDDPSIINLTDNGDGTAEAAAVGVLGTANVHVEATADLGNGPETLTGDLQIVVVAGLAERINIVAGEPEEVTPDEEPVPVP